MKGVDTAPLKAYTRYQTMANKQISEGTALNASQTLSLQRLQNERSAVVVNFLRRQPDSFIILNIPVPTSSVPAPIPQPHLVPPPASPPAVEMDIADDRDDGHGQNPQEFHLNENCELAAAVRNSAKYYWTVFGDDHGHCDLYALRESNKIAFLTRKVSLYATDEASQVWCVSTVTCPCAAATNHLALYGTLHALSESNQLTLEASALLSAMVPCVHQCVSYQLIQPAQTHQLQCPGCHQPHRLWFSCPPTQIAVLPVIGAVERVDNNTDTMYDVTDYIQNTFVVCGSDGSISTVSITLPDTLTCDKASCQLNSRSCSHVQRVRRFVKDNQLAIHDYVSVSGDGEDDGGALVGVDRGLGNETPVVDVLTRSAVAYSSELTFYVDSVNDARFHGNALPAAITVTDLPALCSALDCPGKLTAAGSICEPFGPICKAKLVTASGLAPIRLQDRRCPACYTVYSFTGESFAQLVTGNYVVLFTVYFSLENTFTNCRSAISAWFGAFRSNVNAVGGELDHFNYWKAKQGWWQLLPRRIKHLRLTGSADWSCVQCLRMGSFHLIVDGLCNSIMRTWLVNPVSHDQQDAHVHAPTVCPVSVREDADTAAYMLTLVDRRLVTAFVVATNGLHVVAPVLADVAGAAPLQPAIDIPVTSCDQINEVLFAFHVIKPLDSTPAPFNVVRKLMFDLNGPSFMDSIYNGTDITAVVTFLTELIPLLIAWEDDPASIDQLVLIGKLGLWNTVHQYGGGFAKIIFAATWLPTYRTVLRAAGQLFLSIAGAIVARPSYRKPAEDSCAACEIPYRVYSVAFRSIHKAPLSDALVAAVEQHAAVAVASNSVELLEGATADSVHRGKVTHLPGHVGVAHCAQPTSAAAHEFARTLRDTGVLPIDQFEVRIIADDWDGKLASEAPASLWPSAPAISRPCIYEKSNAPVLPEEDPYCNKFDYSGTRSKLGPGAMTFVCMHGILFGYILMHVFENAQLIMDELQRRFPFCPDLIIYDLACNLHKFMLARDHHYVRDALFVLDRFHTPNHRACSHGYRTTEHMAVMDGVNTEAAEQFNNVLLPLKKCTQGMTFEHHMWTIELFGHHHNAAVNAAAR